MITGILDIVRSDNRRDGLARIRLHAVLQLAGGSSMSAFIHFPAADLTEVECMMLETAVALAAHTSVAGAQPAVIMACSGTLVLVDATVALSPDRVAALRAESEEYREAWRDAA